MALLLACSTVPLIRQRDAADPEAGSGGSDPSTSDSVPSQPEATRVGEPETGPIAAPAPTVDASSGVVILKTVCPPPSIAPDPGVDGRTALLPPEVVSTEPPADVASPMPRHPGLETPGVPPPTQAILEPPSLARTQAPGPARRAWTPVSVSVSPRAQVPARIPVPSRVVDAPRAFDPHHPPEETATVTPVPRPRQSRIAVETVVSALAHRPRAAPRSDDAPTRPPSAPWALPLSLAPTAE